MATRNTKVSLVAEVSGYISGMEAAAKKTREVGTEAEKLGQKKEAIAMIGTGLLAIGAVGAAAVGLAVAKFSEFDEAISNVKASTQESAGNMALLRDAALDFGASSVFTATEAANAIEELGKAGISTADILGGALEGSLNLASAGGLGIARAAEIAATTLQQFNLAGSQTGRVADVLAAGAGKALGSVDDLANGLKFVGPVAASMGVSLEETTGVLALFAQAGIVGEQGGTALRGMLSSLTSPSKAAAKEIENLGINLYDAQGGFLGVENVAGQLSGAYSGLSDEARDASLGILFGNEQITAARVLYQAGAAGVAEMTAAVNDNGYAAQVARDKLDNLRGDVEKLGGAFDTALIRSGSGANDILRTLAQSATFLVDAVGGAPQPLLNVGLAIAAVGSAVALAAGAALLGVPKIVAFNGALALLGISGRSAALGIGLVGGAVAGATLAIGFFVSKQADIAATTAELADTLDDATGGFTNYTRAAIVKKLADEGAFAAAKEAGVSQRELTDAVIEGGSALDDIRAKLDDNNSAVSFFTGQGIAAGNAKSSINDLRTALEDSEAAYDDTKAATDEASASTDELASGMDALAGAATQGVEDIDALKAAIEGFGSAQYDVNQTARDFEAAIDASTEAIAANGATLDINTQEGRDNAAAVDAVGQAALRSAASIYAQTGSQEQASAAIRRGREAVIQQRVALGDTQQQAEAYADSLGLIPDNVSSAINLSGAQNAIDKANQVAAAIRNIPGQRDVVINQVVKQTGAARGDVAAAYASGGAVEGPGTATSDSVVARLSAGEHVLTAADVARMGGQAGVYAFRQQLRSGTPGFADGGAVQYTPATYSPSLSIGDLSPQFTVQVSSKGGVDLLKYVDVSIQQADRSSSLTARMGKQGR
jgi:TP901 family phage tail tape measure protein